DPVRSVRIEAAAAMAGEPDASLSPSERAALERAGAELVAAQELSFDRPEAHLALARYQVNRQHPDEAEAELKRALSIDPAFVPAAVNLADLYRTMGRDRDAEAMLRRALAHAQNHPTLLHTLGLVMVRQKRLGEATELLGAAAQLSPENPRFGYVYAVA